MAGVVKVGGELPMLKRHILTPDNLYSVDFIPRGAIWEARSPGPYIYETTFGHSIKFLSK